MWHIDLQTFDGKKIVNPFAQQSYKTQNSAMEAARDLLKYYPPFVRASIRGSGEDVVSLLDPRWSFAPLRGSPFIAKYLLQHFDEKIFYDHVINHPIDKEKRKEALPKEALENPKEFFFQFMSGSEIFVDYRGPEKRDPHWSTEYTLYVTKVISNGVKGTVVFRLKYKDYHDKSRYWITDMDYMFSLSFKTYIPGEKKIKQLLKTIKTDKNKVYLNQRFQWHFQFAVNQYEEALHAEIEDQIIRERLRDANPEDIKIARIFETILDKFLKLDLAETTSQNHQALQSTQRAVLLFMDSTDNDLIFDAGIISLSKRQKQLWMHLSEKERNFLRRLCNSGVEDLGETDLREIYSIFVL
jgi:hypothetical protein